MLPPKKKNNKRPAHASHKAGTWFTFHFSFSRLSLSLGVRTCECRRVSNSGGSFRNDSPTPFGWVLWTNFCPPAPPSLIHFPLLCGNMFAFPFAGNRTALALIPQYREPEIKFRTLKSAWLHLGEKTRTLSQSRHKIVFIVIDFNHGRQMGAKFHSSCTFQLVCADILLSPDPKGKRTVDKCVMFFPTFL